MHVTCRGQRVCPLLLAHLIGSGGVETCAWPAVLSWLLHRRKLQLLIIQVVRFLSSVSFAIVSGEFLVKMDTLRTTRAVLLALSERASIRRNPVHLIGRVGLDWLLACRDHMAAHVESVMVRSVLRRADTLICWVCLLHQCSIFHSLFGIDGD